MRIKFIADWRPRHNRPIRHWIGDIVAMPEMQACRLIADGTAIEVPALTPDHPAPPTLDAAPPPVVMVDPHTDLADPECDAEADGVVDR